MNNKKLSLDDALEFILNGDDSELESLSEDSDAEDFDVPAVVTDDLENTLFGEVLQPEKEMNDDESSSDEELPPPTKQNNLSKPTKKSYVWEKKSFRNIDKLFSELQVAPPPKEKNGTPYEYFCEFIDSDMIENICTQTNLYHLQKSGKEGVFTKTDINQFTGSYFLMGLVRMPSVRSYWENGMRCSDIADVMSRNKFETLLRHLHFVNNLGVTDETKKSTKLWKQKP